MSEPTATQDEALTALRQAWPAWEIWVVPLALGGEIWCARRHDNHRHLLNGHEPAELAEYLADVTGEPADQPGDGVATGA